MNTRPDSIVEPEVVEPDSSTVVVALGANLDSPVGPPEATLSAVLKELAGLSSAPLRCSEFHHTLALDCPPGSPDFVNAVALLSLDSAWTPQTLLAHLQALEARFGRQRSGQLNQARSLDLDLICFGSRQIQTPELVLPHPRAHQRRFVLAPLAELAPNLQWPGTTMSVSALLRKLDCATIGPSQGP